MVVLPPSRLTTMIGSLLTGDFGMFFKSMWLSLFDNYYRPQFDWGIFSIIFTHMFAFAVIYAILGLIIKKSNVMENNSVAFKLIVYIFLLPSIVFTITLLLPSV